MTKRVIQGSSGAGESTESATSMAAVMDGAPAPENAGAPSLQARRSRILPSGAAMKRFSAVQDERVTNCQAELFYLQKQIQLQTQMIFVMEDGSRVQGIIEWYDRHSIKVRGKLRVLIFKSAIKYLYKTGEVGSAPSE
jgi:sRNA-binding regulator protein Hfq